MSKSGIIKRQRACAITVAHGPVVLDTKRQASKDIARRKSEHLDIVMSGTATAQGVTTGLDRVRFEHCALPEIDLDCIDLSTEFLGRQMAAPFLISSMTGGPMEADRINSAIAEAAGALRIGFAVGSQRIALEGHGEIGFSRRLRALAGGVPLLANFGAAQLKHWNGPDMAQRAIDMIDADALIIHLNPLQEAVQRGGDRDWSNLLVRIETLAHVAQVPLIVKEVGGGISSRLAGRLWNAGVSMIDVAGAGGTSWAAVEAARAKTPAAHSIAHAFRDWGIPTADAIVGARSACPDATIIASGGIRDGVDAAKAIRLGADLVAQAAGVLPAALAGPARLVEHIAIVIEQLRIACFCTASAKVADLKRAPLVG